MKKLKITSILMSLTLVLLLLTACGGKGAETSATPTATASPKVSAQPTGEPATKITIKDMAGRSVTIPTRISGVISTGQPGAVMLYTLCREKLVAWNSELSAESLVYISENSRKLPVVGSMQGGNTTASKEEIAALAPDVIVYMTTIAGSTVSTADSIQESMGIPVVVVEFDMENLGESYRFLGGILGCAEKAESLGSYCDNLVKEVSLAASGISKENRVSFYYTSGGKGFQTSPSGSTHTEIIEIAGGVNVVNLEAKSNGRLTVNMEQVMTWAPKVIITAASDSASSSVYEQVMSGGETWGILSAVKNGNVLTAPSLPFSWLDAPVSVNRIIGLVWIAEKLYPDVYKYDIAECAKEFYSMFYGIDLTDEQLVSILGKSK